MVRRFGEKADGLGEMLISRVLVARGRKEQSMRVLRIFLYSRKRHTRNVRTPRVVHITVRDDMVGQREDDVLELSGGCQDAGNRPGVTEECTHKTGQDT